MKNRSFLAVLVAFLALVFLAGCGVFEFRMPEQFKDEKTVEDPPLGQVPAAPLLQERS